MNWKDIDSILGERGFVPVAKDGNRTDYAFKKDFKPMPVEKKITDFRFDPSQAESNWRPLLEDTKIDGVEFAKDSRYRAFETLNYGWVVFEAEAKTPEGKIPRKRVFRAEGK